MSQDATVSQTTQTTSIMFGDGLVRAPSGEGCGASYGPVLGRLLAEYPANYQRSARSVPARR